MKKHVLAFISGVLATVLFITLAMPALAETVTTTIEAALNAVNVTLNDETVITSGEDYTLSDGTGTASSIIYNDTTYLPVRAISEALDLDIGWNSDTNTVYIVDDSVTVIDTEEDEDEYESPEDSAEFGELTYEEYYALWDISVAESNINTFTGEYTTMYYAKYTGELSYDDCYRYLLQGFLQYEDYMEQMIEDLTTEESVATLYFLYKDGEPIYWFGG